MSFSTLLAQIKKDKPQENGSSPISKSLSSNKQSIRTTNDNNNKKSISSLKSRSQSPSTINDDPAVMRLKEARRKEKEKQMLAKGVTPKKPVTPKSSSSLSSTTGNKKRISSLPAKPLLSNPNNQSPLPIKQTRHKPIDPRTLIRRSSPAPKLSFKELMAQADNKNDSVTKQTVQDTKNLPIKKKPYKSASGSAGGSNNINNDYDYNSNKSRNQSLPLKASRLSQQQRKAGLPQKPIPRPRPRPTGPAPFAKPSKELMNKLKQKDSMTRIPNRPRSNNRLQQSSIQRDEKQKQKQKDSYGIDAVSEDEDSEFDHYYDKYDSEDDNFIDDDGDYEAERKRAAKLAAKRRGYDRDEIWSIFKRDNGDQGKRRYDDYYDDYDDDDDMEATGAEILEDEERTLKQARLDDIREQKLLEKKQLDKQRKLKRK